MVPSCVTGLVGTAPVKVIPLIAVAAGFANPKSSSFAPLAVSITDGIAFGFIAYALLKVATGRQRELSWLGYLFAILFLGRYAIR